MRNKSFYPWVVWGLAASFFFCGYFVRVSPNVMAPDLMQAFHITALGLSGLAAFFYYPYVAMQVPVGILVDKFGARRLLIAMSLVTGMSCFIFGSATSFIFAEVGRLLIGFSAAFAFVSSLKLARSWFHQSRFGLLAGLTQALGMLGAAFGAWPVSATVDVIGWRSTMFVMGSAFVVLCFLIFSFVQDTPKGQRKKEASSTSSIPVLSSLYTILRNPQSWYNAIYAGLCFAPTAVFAELWGVTYLTHVQGFSKDLAAVANGFIFLGWGIGGPLLGWISDRMQRRRPVMIVSGIGSGILMSVILYGSDLSVFLLFPALFLFGLFNGGLVVAYAVAAEINPARISGISMSFANMMSVIVGAFLHPVIGWLIDWQAGIRVVGGTAEFVASDFRYAMLLLPISAFLSVIFSLFVRETHCRVVK